MCIRDRLRGVELMRVKKKYLIEWLLIILSGILIYFLVDNDAFLYKNPVAQIVSVTNSKATKTEDTYKNKDMTTEQTLKVKVLNGHRKGEVLTAKNTFSKSGGYDQRFYRGQKVFVKFENSNGKVMAMINNYKRDVYLIMLCWAVVVLLFLVTQIRGFTSLISVILNFIIFLLCVQLDVKWNINNFFWIFATVAVIFLALSLVLVIGFNWQCLVTFSSIFIGTTLAMIIGVAAMQVTNDKGVHYEALDFATQSPKQLFLAATVIGLLGAVMDAATDIVSTLFEMKRTQPGISRKQLFISGQNVGKSIMGPLVNVLLLIFFAETVTMAVLFFRTGNSIAYTFEWTMSLGIIQSLISGIGITLVIPSASLLSSLVLGGDKK